MRKPLSSDQKWFLRPYFPLIGGIFVLKSGLRFLFRALEVSIQKVRKSHFLSWKRVFSSLSEWALPMPETKIWDHFSIQIYPLLVGNGVRLFARRTFITPKIRTFTTPKFRHLPPPKKNICQEDNIKLSRPFLLRDVLHDLHDNHLLLDVLHDVLHEL